MDLLLQALDTPTTAESVSSGSTDGAHMLDYYMAPMMPHQNLSARLPVKVPGYTLPHAPVKSNVTVATPEAMIHPVVPRKRKSTLKERKLRDAQIVRIREYAPPMHRTDDSASNKPMWLYECLIPHVIEVCVCVKSLSPWCIVLDLLGAKLTSKVLVFQKSLFGFTFYISEYRDNATTHRREPGARTWTCNSTAWRISCGLKASSRRRGIAWNCSGLAWVYCR